MEGTFSEPLRVVYHVDATLPEHSLALHRGDTLPSTVSETIQQEAVGHLIQYRYELRGGGKALWLDNSPDGSGYAISGKEHRHLFNAFRQTRFQFSPHGSPALAPVEQCG